MFPARPPADPPGRAGGQWWSALLGDWLEEPTQLLPIYDLPPDTTAGRVRGNGGGKR